MCLKLFTLLTKYAEETIITIFLTIPASQNLKSSHDSISSGVTELLLIQPGDYKRLVTFEILMDLLKAEVSDYAVSQWSSAHEVFIFHWKNFIWPPPSWVAACTYLLSLSSFVKNWSPDTSDSCSYSLFCLIELCAEVFNKLRFTDQEHRMFSVVEWGDVVRILVNHTFQNRNSEIHELKLYTHHV